MYDQIAYFSIIVYTFKIGTTASLQHCTTWAHTQAAEEPRPLKRRLHELVSAVTSHTAPLY